MKKILKCVLAFALLSMVFTSTVLAEGSVTSGVTVDGANISDIKDYTGDNKDLVNGVNSKVSSSDKATSLGLPESVTSALKDAGITVDDNTAMTKFYNIEGTPNTPFTVNLGASLLGSATKVAAVHVKGNDVEVVLATSFDKTAGTATFKVDSFSPFAFVIQNEPTWVYVPSKPAGSGKNPVVNTAAGEVNHTNYMAYAAVASVVAVGAIILASKKLAKNAK